MDNCFIKVSTCSFRLFIPPLWERYLQENFRLFLLLLFPKLFWHIMPVPTLVVTTQNGCYHTWTEISHNIIFLFKSQWYVRLTNWHWCAAVVHNLANRGSPYNGTLIDLLTYYGALCCQIVLANLQCLRWFLIFWSDNLVSLAPLW